MKLIGWLCMSDFMERFDLFLFFSIFTIFMFLSGFSFSSCVPAPSSYQVFTCCDLIIKIHLISSFFTKIGQGIGFTYEDKKNCKI